MGSHGGPVRAQFYTKIAYLVLHFISEGKIIIANPFKIIPPHVVRKIKKNLDANFLYEPIFDLKNFVHWD